MLTGITTRFPTALLSLKELNLSFNLLSGLPSEMVAMTTLETLKIANNQLKNRLEPLPRMVQLRSLNLRGNGITEVPSTFMNMLSLQTLNLSKNELKTLPSNVVGKLQQLTKLDLSENKIVAIPYTIDRLTSLKILRMHSNRVNVLPRELASLTGLTELSIRNLYIDGAC